VGPACGTTFAILPPRRQKRKGPIPCYCALYTGEEQNTGFLIPRGKEKGGEGHQSFSNVFKEDETQGGRESYVDRSSFPLIFAAGKRKEEEGGKTSFQLHRRGTEERTISASQSSCRPRRGGKKKRLMDKYVVHFGGRYARCFPMLGGRKEKLFLFWAGKGIEKGGEARRFPPSCSRRATKRKEGRREKRGLIFSSTPGRECGGEAYAAANLGRFTMRRRRKEIKLWNR